MKQYKTYWNSYLSHGINKRSSIAIKTNFYCENWSLNLIVSILE
jgi:hypothetical protein